jgi:hypothetical protein
LLDEGIFVQKAYYLGKMLHQAVTRVPSPPAQVFALVYVLFGERLLDCGIINAEKGEPGKGRKALSFSVARDLYLRKTVVAI